MSFVIVVAGADPNRRDEEFEGHVRRGGELLREDRVERARDELRAALALKPTEVRALALLGLACFRLDAFDEALGVYRTLVAEQPDDASYRLNLGLVHLKLGDARSALDELLRSRELDPTQVRTIGYLGLAYARNGQYGPAYAAFLRAEQPALAREMEQHLSVAERDAIRAGVAGEADAPAPPAVVEIEADPGFPPEPSRTIVVDDPDLPGDFDTEPSAAPSSLAGSIGERIGERHLAAVSGLITRAVAIAAPPRGDDPAVIVGDVAPGPSAARPLAGWTAERVIRTAGAGALELAADGALIVRVAGRVLSRTDGVVARGGALTSEPATRRFRGAASTEPLGEDGRRLAQLSGDGFLVVEPGDGVFAALALDGDILYVREDLVFAFEEHLRWESGKVPGSAIRVVQLRGRGDVALRSARPLASIALAEGRPIQVDARALAGWVGRVVPRLASDGEGVAAVECAGEGVVLVELRTPRVP
jgi:uncharacterized protein (AIM24 family)